MAAPTPSSSSSNKDDLIKLSIFCPVRPSSPGKLDTALYPSPELVEVTPSTSVRELKQRLEESIVGGPAADGQVLIWRGRRLKDDERLGEVVGEQLEGTPQDGTYNLHLSVPPGSWKAASQAGSTTIDPSNAAARAAAERLAALSTTFNGDTSPSAQASQFPQASSVSADTQPSSPTHHLQLPLPSLQLPSGTASTSNPAMPSPGLIPPASTDPSKDPGRGNLLSAMSQAASAAPSPWRTFFIHLHQLSSSQRSEFLLKLVSADAHYAILARGLAARQPVTMESLSQYKPEAIAGQLEQEKTQSEASSQDGELHDYELEQQTEALLQGVGLNDKIDQAVQSAQEKYILNEEFQRKAFGGTGITSQLVTIGGYPFLLQIPKSYVSARSQEKRMEDHLELERCRAIQGQLSAMLHIARATTGSYAAASAAYRSRYAAALGPGAGTGAGVGGVPQGYPGPPAGFGAVGIGAQAAARLAGQALPAGATARLAVVINIDEILRLLIPLTFLSVKLGFLIYIFGRHANPTKRYVMIGMAVLWVFWEGVTIRRRRRQFEARRALNGQVVQAVGQAQAQHRAEDLAAQAQAQAQAQGNDQARQGAPPQLPQGHLPPLQPGQVDPPLMAELRDRQRLERRAARAAAALPEGANGNIGRPPHQRGQAGGSSRSSSHRPPPNRLSPKYWMQTVAKVGLAAEAREMGISRSSLNAGTSFTLAPATATATGNNPAAQQNGTAAIQYRIQPRPQRMTAQRFFRNLMVFVVLFLGTLVPEIERLRKKYLDKRQKKIVELENARTAMMLQREQRERERRENVARNGVEQSLTGGQEGNTGQQAGSEQERSQGLPTGIAGGNAPQTTDTMTPAPQSTQMALQSSEESSSSHDQSRNQSLVVPPAPGTTGVEGEPNISDSPAEGELELFDPPFDEDALAAAFGTAPPALTRQGQREHQQPRPGDPVHAIENASSSTSSSSSAVAARSSAGPSPASSTTRPIPPNRLRVPRPGDNESMHLGVNADDISTPTTPLLSPAELETEDEDDRDGGEGDGVDDEVGMILF